MAECVDSEGDYEEDQCAFVDACSDEVTIDAVPGEDSSAGVGEVDLANVDDQCNGDVGLEIAVEAHPDLAFEADCVPQNLESVRFEQPRVYLERESFSNESVCETPADQVPEPQEEIAECHDGSDSAVWRNQKKHFFILSEAGKPIYTRHGNEEQLITLFGVMQALVSVVEDDQDSLNVIRAGDTKFVFTHRPPLILVAVSRLRDSIGQLQLQLGYMYNQILSVITGTQLDRIFEQRRNYDLRRLLAGSERLMDSILNYMDNDYSVLLGAIRCLPMAYQDREAVTQTITQQCSKIKNLMFGLLIGNNQLISMVRMRKLMLQPSDVHLIINLVSCSETFKTAEGWTPICLPGYDASCFLYAHASYLSDDCQACLLFFTSDRDAFFTLSDAKRRIVERLRRHNILETITNALNHTPPVLKQVGAPEIRHLLYKSRLTNQYVCSTPAPPYLDDQAQQHLMDMYRHLHGRVHCDRRPLKLVCHTAEKEIHFAVVSSSYELYMILEPMTSKVAVNMAVSAVLKWIKREEDNYFCLHSATW